MRRVWGSRQAQDKSCKRAWSEEICLKVKWPSSPKCVCRETDLYKQLPSPAIHSCRRCGAMAFAWAIKIASASSMQVNLAIRRRSRRTSWESLYVHEVYIVIFCNYSNDQPRQIKSGVSLPITSILCWLQVMSDPTQWETCCKPRFLLANLLLAMLCYA